MRAAEILSLRKQKGSFKQVEELEAVRGIGPAMLAKMRPHVVLSGRTTAQVGTGKKAS